MITPLHSRPWRTAVALVFLIAGCSAAGVVPAGCAGELPVPGQMTTATVTGPTTSATESPTASLAGQVADAWEEAVQKLLPLIQGAPDAASVQPQVADLKERYVQRLVAVGREIRSLSASDQRSTYDKAMGILSAQGATDWFADYKAVYEQYAARTDQESQDFAVLLSTFNTLTEYAFFDVLKAQDPAEATRLGVE